MSNLPKRAISNLRHRWLGHRLAVLGRDAWVDRHARIEYPGNVHVAADARIEHGVVVRGNTADSRGDSLAAGTSVKDYAVINANQGNVTVGERTWVGPYCLIYGNGGVDIGADVLIAAHTSINTVSHIAERTDIPMNDQGIRCDPIVIQDDVWIGLNCTILQGFTIGHGSIIGAGAVVTRDIPPGSIAVGTPARVVKQRQQSDVADARSLLLERAS
ncbi:MAG: acyltransferase [Gammaproteobacteria bacterium]|nr:MAG: acyltransferase [Gammaproteobacteria bacterium]